MKYNEITTMDVAKLKKELASLETKVLELRVKVKLGQAKNVHELKNVRKSIARIKTFLTTLN